MNYNKQLLIANIYAIAKKKGLKIKDIEATAGVSTGYFLRMYKDEANPGASPTVSTMLSVSDTLGVSIESLSSHNFEEEELPSIKIISFLDKAIEKTKACELRWASEDPSDFDKGNQDYDQTTPLPVSKHPLFAFEDTSDQYNSMARCKFHSKFVTLYCAPVRLLHYFELKGSKYYLLYVATSDDNDREYYHYEMYVVKNNKAHPLCSSLLGNKSLIATRLEELYSLIEKISAESPAGEEALDAIDDFLKEMSDKEKQDGGNTNEQ